MSHWTVREPDDNKEQSYSASAGEQCVNCKGWISPPLVAFVISDSQRYPACVCGNPCSQRQALIESIFGKAPSPPKLPPARPSVSPRQCPGPPLMNFTLQWEGCGPCPYEYNGQGVS